MVCHLGLCQHKSQWILCLIDDYTAENMQFGDVSLRLRNEAALVLIVRLSKPKTSNVFVLTSSRSSCLPLISLQVRPFWRCWTVNDWGLLQLRGVINFNKRPPRLSAFIKEHLRAMDNLTTLLSPP